MKVLCDDRTTTTLASSAATSRPLRMISPVMASSTAVAFGMPVRAPALGPASPGAEATPAGRNRRRAPTRFAAQPSARLVGLLDWSRAATRDDRGRAAPDEGQRGLVPVGRGR